MKLRLPRIHPSWQRCLWILLASLLCASAALAQEALRVGLLPIFTPRVLVDMYQPLRTYLEQGLGRPVVLYTAPDFRAFHQETRAGAYDLVLTAAHFARLAELEQAFLPLAAYTSVNRPLLVAARQRPLRELSDLRGETLAVFDPLALNVLMALHWIEAQGLHPGKDFQVLEAPGHNSVAHALVSGKARLGVSAPTGLNNLQSPLREEIVIWRELPATVALAWLAHPRLKQEAARLRGLLLRFPETAPGQAFLARSGYQGLRPLRAGELGSLDPIVRELERRLREVPR